MAEAPHSALDLAVAAGTLFAIDSYHRNNTAQCLISIPAEHVQRTTRA